MKRILFAATILAAPLLAGTGASAQPIQGIYVGAGAGANFLSDERVRSFSTSTTTFSVTQGTRISLSTGYTGLGSVGWGFGNGVRLEVEGSYRRNDYANGASSPGRGAEEKYGAMGNVLFDLDIGSPYVFPYFGAGAGYQSVHPQASSTATGGLAGTGFAVSTRTSGTQGSFAYQAMAGFAFPIPGVVGLSLTAEYRYLGLAGDRSFTTTSTATGGPAPGFIGVGLSPSPTTIRTSTKLTEDNNHSLMVGLRYAFNVVPPGAAPIAVAAPPAPASSRSFLVFFDWDKSDLSDRARQIIAQAAQSSTSSGVTRIEVDGHADKSGTGAYNQGLSRRRADSVAAELVRDGVPRAAISVLAFGDTRPLVPTAAGVREPQNRRVEIILK